PTPVAAPPLSPLRRTKQLPSGPPPAPQTQRLPLRRLPAPSPESRADFAYVTSAEILQLIPSAYMSREGSAQSYSHASDRPTPEKPRIRKESTHLDRIAPEKRIGVGS